MNLYIKKHSVKQDNFTLNDIERFEHKIQI